MEHLAFSSRLESALSMLAASGDISNFTRPVATRDEWLGQILNINGLDGSSPIDSMDDEIYVAGESGSPEMQERYQSQAARRRYRTDE